MQYPASYVAALDEVSERYVAHAHDGTAIMVASSSRGSWKLDGGSTSKSAKPSEWQS